MSRNKADSIDVGGLSDKDIKMVEEFINILRERSKTGLKRKRYHDSKIVFTTRESDVIGSLTREEIHD